MNTWHNLTLAAAIGCALAAAGTLLDGGPDAEQIERAQAADLADAQKSAQRFDRDLNACRRAMGSDADLVQIQRTGAYVCRVVPSADAHVAQSSSQGQQ